MKKFILTEQEKLKSIFTNEYSFQIPKFQPLKSMKLIGIKKQSYLKILEILDLIKS